MKDKLESNLVYQHIVYSDRTYYKYVLLTLSCGSRQRDTA